MMGIQIYERNMLNVQIKLNNSRDLGSVEIVNEKTDYRGRADYAVLVKEQEAFGEDVTADGFNLEGIDRQETSAMKLLYLALHKYYKG